jgi:hypothetical protein
VFIQRFESLAMKSFIPDLPVSFVVNETTPCKGLKVSSANSKKIPHSAVFGNRPVKKKN